MQLFNIPQIIQRYKKGDIAGLSIQSYVELGATCDLKPALSHTCTHTYTFALTSAHLQITLSAIQRKVNTHIKEMAVL